MMKKKISILTLTFLFLVSTTGLPFFYHYCEMIGKKSLSECSDCAEDKEETFSCCSMEEPEFEIQMKAESSTCCIDEFDYKKIEDNFSPTANQNSLTFSTTIIEVNSTSFDTDSENKNSQQTNYDLPPPKFGKQLLHSLHQLKIDLPVC